MALGGDLWNLLTVGNVLLSFLFLLLLHYLIEFYEFRRMPPGPRFDSIPILGSILSFDGGAGKSLLERTQSLMKKYGRVFSLRMGSFKVVVAASANSVKEVLVKRSGDYAGRPPFHSFDILIRGKDIVLTTYGPAWRLHRKLFMTALRLYLKDATLVESRVNEQARHILRYFSEQNGKAFDPNDVIPSSVSNVICAIIFGNKFNSSHPDFPRLLQLLETIFVTDDMNQQIAFLDLFSWIRHFPIKAYQWLRELIDEIRGIFRKQLREGEKEFHPGEPISDLIGALIKARNEAEMGEAEERAELLSEDHLVGSIHDMFVAGYETTTTTLRFAIAYLINFPEYQIKIQKELDSAVGRERFPSLDDRPNLPITQAVIMEVQRLGNIADSVPHYTITDTTLCGYRVPKGTVVMANLEAVHRDPECWENPEEFNPYRYIDADGNLITGQGNWLPFSAGRRVCAGESLAKIELFLFLSIMLQSFTFVPEEGNEPPRLKGEVKLLTKRPHPYKVMAVKRRL